ncbi:hypothetical protein AFB00_20745 [Pseudonocardia sp. HH130630-07]|nr:hypothetical protein AFB00_20745 [Pseudonocardia sp. HH130630-07]
MSAAPRTGPRIRPWQVMVAVVVSSALAAVAPVVPAAAEAGPAGFYAAPDDQADAWVAGHQGDGRAALIGERIAAVPQGRWFTTTDTAGVRAEVDAYVGAAAATGTTPIVVVYDLPGRDCGGASSGGAPSHEAYRAWIDQVALGVAGRRAAVVLEPDALAQTDCRSAEQQDATEASLAYAAGTIKDGSAATKVYLDAGNSAWTSPEEMADRLTAAGVAEHADGIATNVSNFGWLGDETAYAKAVLGAIGSPGLTAVIDTSRNGNGPAGGGEWCDPAGRASGPEPSRATGDAQIAAWLWVKGPGESDGCAAAPGTFDPQVAYDLAAGS